MLMLIAREPRPDAGYWPGRRWLAAVDAVIWPLLWIALIRQLPPESGVVGAVGIAVAVLCCVGRLYRALWVNERYWFTTWRWGRVVAALLLVGAVLKMTV